jgi:hypothetical protein
MRAASCRNFYVPGKYPAGVKREFYYKTYFNFWLFKLEEELEAKLPNEFKGSIINYNPYNAYRDGVNIWIDENQYSI